MFSVVTMLYKVNNKHIRDGHAGVLIVYFKSSKPSVY